MLRYFRSMGGRIFLILIVGTTISAILTQLLVEHQHQQLFEQFVTLRASERAAQSILALQAVPREARTKVITEAKRFGIQIEEGVGTSRDSVNLDFTRALQHAVPELKHVKAYGESVAACGALAAELATFTLLTRHRCYRAEFEINDGTAWHIALLAGPPSPPNGASGRMGLSSISDVTLYAILFIGFIGLLAYMVSRIATRPLRYLAQAATDLGQDLSRAPLAIEGPSEVRRATTAFNAMQARIRKHLAERTEMLAAIAHDLQTPLTRMRLRLEQVQDVAVRDKLIANLASMQQNIAEGLDLLRSTTSTEVNVQLDLDSLVDSVVHDAIDAGQDVQVSGRIRRSLRGRPNALRRCFTNLIDNAVKYGHYARVELKAEQDTAVILIQDGGPGIPPAQLDAVFTPFFRLEGSRSRETGGTGLGLSIARNLLETQGGTIELANLSGGGLEARIILPLHHNS